MRNSHTSVVDLRQVFTGEFATEPYECCWASEAIYFLTVEAGFAEFDTFVARVQISADGIEWVDEGSVLPTIVGPGLSFCRVSRFGGWLRLAGELRGGDAMAMITVRLALKE